MRRRRSPARVAVVVVLAVALLGIAWLYTRPLPTLTSKAVAVAPSNGSVDSATVPWPAYGQSAIGIKGYGPLVSTSAQKPQPTASVAKLMTALAVLDKKPLTPGQPGPMLTVTAKDLEVYNYYFALGGSLTAIQEGEKISQYDVLEAVLLPSANNMSNMLASWAFGSEKAYAEYANQYAKKHGLAQTNIEDASGFSPKTVSTAEDLVRLGSLALEHPVVAEIVAKRTAEVPVAGTIYNVNGLLGRNGINGLKTGNTDEAGGVFVVSADRTLADGTKTTAIAAVMGGPDLETAMRATLPLLDAGTANITSQKVIKQGQVFGTYTPPWGGPAVKAVAARDVSLLSWQGAEPAISASLKPLTGTPAKGASAGAVKVTSGDTTQETPLILSEAVSAPTPQWRLFR